MNYAFLKIVIIFIRRKVWGNRKIFYKNIRLILIFLLYLLDKGKGVRTMNKQKCGKETEVYSRVVGFYRPTKLWNKGKKEEYRLRKEFSLSKADLRQNSNEEKETAVC